MAFKQTGEKTFGTYHPNVGSLGVRDIFDVQKAALNDIAEGPLEVGEILHRAQLEVTEEGAEAAAVTSIEIDVRVAISGTLTELSCW